MSFRALAWLGLLLAGCRMSGPAPAATGGPGRAVPVVAPGRISDDEQAEAARLYESAERSFSSRRFYEVLRTTSELVERFPASDVSGAAVLLGARAEAELGAPERADAAAERYIALLPAGDRRATEARLLQARAWDGNPATQLDRLLRVERARPPDDLDAAISLARSAADSLAPEQLADVLASAPADGLLAPIVQSRQAVNLLEAGDDAEAAELAVAALGGIDIEPERTFAEGVLRGELPEGRGRTTAFTIATVLPRGGPPGLAEFAELVSEGIEVAAATALGEPFQVTVLDRDDQADPALAATLMSELESEDDVVGVVGFLEDQALLDAGHARQVGLPIVSPTARTAADAGEGVYSLEGADPQAAADIARYAATRAYQRVAIVLPETPAANAEADAFAAEAGRLGIPVVGRFPYEPGATFFESQIIGARNVLRRSEVAALGLGEEDTLHLEVLEPVGIFMPIPREDVEFVAPQIAHFALDTLAIEIVGTSAWTDPVVLESVEPRYLNGIVATAPLGAGPASAGRERFRVAYEDHFQRTLVNPTPAIGYDAALLLLEALRPGRVRPDQVVASFDELHDIEGATGIFSVVDGRVVRSTQVVTIRNGALIPVPPEWIAVPAVPGEEPDDTLAAPADTLFSPEDAAPTPADSLGLPPADPLPTPSR